MAQRDVSCEGAALAANYDEARAIRVLRATLASASRAPFYRSRIDVAGLASLTLETFQKVPCTNKSDLAEFGWDMLTSRRFPDYIGLSGGRTWTPGRPPSLRFGTREDGENHGALRDEAIDLDVARPRSVTLELVSQLHGVAPTLRPWTLRLPFERRDHAAMVFDLLGRRLDFEGAASSISVLSGSVHHLRQLAALVVRLGVDTSEWRLLGVIAHSAHLMDRWRKYLETVFGTRVVSAYGISEINGSAALMCEACATYHMPPSAFAEYLPLDSDEGVAPIGGIGELVLTSLLPFQEIQPLIRYRTGDLIAIGSSPCPAGLGLGFRPIGRRGESTLRSADDLAHVIPRLLLQEAIEEVPWVHREAYAGNHRLGLGGEPGAVNYDVQPVSRPTAAHAFDVHVTVDLPTSEFSGVAAQLQREIEDSIQHVLSTYDCHVGVRVVLDPVELRSP